MRNGVDEINNLDRFTHFERLTPRNESTGASSSANVFNFIGRLFRTTVPPIDELVTTSVPLPTVQEGNSNGITVDCAPVRGYTARFNTR
jgi:hypothetical protein